MKDETFLKAIREFIGVRAKMYSLDCVDHVKKRAKEVTKTVIQRRFTHKSYLNAIRQESTRRAR